MRYVTLTVCRTGHAPQVEHAACLCDGTHHTMESRVKTVRDILLVVEERVPAAELESITIVFSRADPV